MPAYESLVQEIHHYVTSIAKAPAIQDLLTRLLQALHMDRPRSAQVAQNLLKEEASWQQSHHQFRKRLAEEYALYPDSVAPLQASILQLQHGMRLVASEVYTSFHGSVVCADRLGALATSLLAFPSVGPTFPTYYAHADALCSVKSEEVLRGLGKLILKRSGGRELEGKGQRPCPTREQLLMNALLYLRSHVLCKGELDQRALQLFRHICQVSPFSGGCPDLLLRGAGCIKYKQAVCRMLAIPCVDSDHVLGQWDLVLALFFLLFNC